jgi:hypothetical protein
MPTYKTGGRYFGINAQVVGANGSTLNRERREQTVGNSSHHRARLGGFLLGSQPLTRRAQHLR